ncbi:MAG TPA: glycosyltransferase family 2 protein [Caldilineae bacterium]|nr:glycosyltransferase family 2 protein [Caldilineae bacterium]
MKLIVQIPCLNEEETLPATVADIPRVIAGIDQVELLIIDDGSNDRTVEIARALGVEHIVRFTQNRGLAAAFAAGLDACLKLGADIIVNTDGDNQYAGADIPKLIAPILAGEADIVIGDRETDTIAHFSPAKKRLQKLGSWVVRQASGTTIPDTTSGFRAYSRDAALRINITTDYSYTLETIIQAGKQHLAVGHVPVGTNPKLRESRLIGSIWSYLRRSATTIVRVYTMYEPLRVFVSAGILLLLGGLALSLRYLYFVTIGEGKGHVQSVIIAAVLFIAGFQVIVIGLMADLIAINRRLSEDILLRVKRLEMTAQNDNDD